MFCFIFFLKASHSAAETQTDPPQFSNQELLFCTRKRFNLKNISDGKNKLDHFHELIKKKNQLIIIPLISPNSSPR